jgi:hypothetical protein
MNDGTNTGAQFTAPVGLALDLSSNIYVADGNAIRRISPSGTNWVVTTLVGSVLVHGTNDGTNGVARFDNPQGVAVDGGGNLFVADTLNNAIRKVTPIGTNWVVSTVAGLPGRTNTASADGTNTTARFYQPFGIAADSATNLYVADTLNYTIRKVTPQGTNWVVTTLAGSPGLFGSADGTNNAARFGFPSSVAVDSVGTLYVTDFASNTIRKITLSGTNRLVSTFAGFPGATGSNDGLGTNAHFNLPQCIAVDSTGNLFVTDSGNNTIRKVTPPGLVSTLAGMAGVSGTTDATGASARFTQPYGLAVGGAGALYISDYLGYTIRQGRLAAVLQYMTSGNQLVLFWPTGLTGFVLQASSNLPATSWIPLTNGVATSGQYFVLTNNPPPPLSVYRLKK